MTPDAHVPQALLTRLQVIRAEVLAEAAELASTFRPFIERQCFADSAQNLASYLALRRHDLREVQPALARWGLSSLGRSESRVSASLDAVVASLGAICKSDASTLPAHPNEEQMFRGARIVAEEAASLLGEARPHRDTRIMVTLAAEMSSNVSLMTALLEAGMECVRINCAHDDQEVWREMLDTVRHAERALGNQRRTRILMDLGGPKVRTVRPKKLENDRYHVGDRLLLTRSDEVSRKHQKPKLPVVGCTLHEALDCLSPGERVYIDDGKIGTRVIERLQRGAVLEIFQATEKGSRIRSRKGLNFPDTEFVVSPLTDKDRADLRFVAEHADLLGYSFVQAEGDVDSLLDELREARGGRERGPALVLKIETKRAVRNLPGLIVRAAGRLPTAIMIARGDLALELGFQRMAEMQEEILWLCEAAHVPVIWATQVLEGLAKNGLPTRAEVTDAAMSSRAECVMLNKGPHIVEAVAMLDDVLARMETHQYKKTPKLRVLHSWESMISAPAAARAEAAS